MAACGAGQIYYGDNLEKMDYPGEPELSFALELMRDHVTGFASMDEAVPFEVDASFQHDRVGPVPCSIAIGTIDSPYHKNQCYKISMVLKATQFEVDSTISIGEAGTILRFLEEMRDPAKVKAILVDTFSNLAGLEDRSGMA